MWSLRWHFTNKSVTGAPYSIKSFSLSHSWTLRWRVRWLKQCHLVVAAEMQQRWRRTNRRWKSIPRSSSSHWEGRSLSVMRRVNGMTSVKVEALRRRQREPMSAVEWRVSARYDSAVPIRREHITRTFSQCSSRRSGVMCSDFLAENTRRAAAL